MRSSVHLADGRLTLRFPIRGLHSSIVLPHRPSALRAMWPVHCQAEKDYLPETLGGSGGASPGSLHEARLLCRHCSISSPSIESLKETKVSIFISTFHHNHPISQKTAGHRPPPYVPTFFLVLDLIEGEEYAGVILIAFI